MPQTCRRCGKMGHKGKNCTEDACRYCRVTGHTTKDCPKSKTCNLCGLAAHSYKDCPQRERTWASVAARAPKPAPAPEPAPRMAKPTKEGKKAKAPPLPCPVPPLPPHLLPHLWRSCCRTQRSRKSWTLRPTRSTTSSWKGATRSHRSRQAPEKRTRPTRVAKGRQQACAKKWDFRKLQRELRSLQDLLQCGWDVREELEETKKSLKRHFEEESKRIVFRSKVENLEKGEKCNSFFFRKLHAGHTPLTELRDETGHMRSGKEEVMGVVSDFYSNLYAPKSSDPESTERFLSELFAETILQNGETRGITAPGPDRYEVKRSLHMDDVTSVR
ncbi:uncharacterized protein LOC130302811 [Hyla sarda]|uniref:uncharacterized protein LOC130302811 n=1 Tax=Hyla sarda TaxID=327740 RepID=UPI0024C2CA0A|nr:uncharacterized protein LOC130302811 [Hyla sarda]